MYETPVIIDCDPGDDDTVALMLAVRHLDVRGVTTVGGRVGLSRGTRNALSALEISGRPDIPVFAGHAEPITNANARASRRPLYPTSDGPELGDPSGHARSVHAVDFLIRTARQAPPDGLTLVTTGPLTNIASALYRAPDIADHLAEIVVGGGAPVDDLLPDADFTVFADPEAATAVFRSGVPVRLSGAALIRQCIYGPEQIADLATIPTASAQLTAAALEHICIRAAERKGPPVAMLPDACTMAWLIRPELVAAAPASINVELASPLTRGMTVCELRSPDGTNAPRAESAPLARVGLRLDLDGFHILLSSTLAGLP